MKYDILHVLKVSGIVMTMCINLVILGTGTYFFIKYKPMLTKLSNAHYRVNLETDISIKTTLPLSATVDTQISIPADYDIPLSLPLKTVVSIPIDQTLIMELDEVVPVSVFHKFNIDKNFQLQATLPIDTVIETEIFGLNTDLPIDVDIPVDVNVPVKEDLVLDEVLPLHLIKPVPVRVKQNVEIPIDHVFEAVFPVKGNILLPLKADMTTEIKVDKTVPCILGVDLSFDKKEEN